MTDHDTGRRATLRRRYRASLAADREGGTTMMELVVAMTLMSVFMAIFTTAMVSMFSASSKILAVQNSSTQLSTAFERLDTQVRYATAIDQPVAPTAANPYWSVTFLSAGDPTASPVAASTCTQLAVGTVPAGAQQRLAERTWTVDGNGVLVAGPTGWNQLALGVTNGAATDQPFSLVAAPGSIVQQLHLLLIDRDVTAKTLTQSVSETTFTALNSVAAATAAAKVPVGTPVATACSMTGIS